VLALEYLSRTIYLNYMELFKTKYPTDIARIDGVSGRVYPENRNTGGQYEQTFGRERGSRELEKERHYDQSYTDRHKQGLINIS
jgi:hypothetical protein